MSRRQPDPDHEMCISLVLAFSGLPDLGPAETVLEERLSSVAKELRSTLWYRLPARVKAQLAALARSIREQTELTGAPEPDDTVREPVNYDN